MSDAENSSLALLRAFEEVFAQDGIAMPFEFASDGNITNHEPVHDDDNLEYDIISSNNDECSNTLDLLSERIVRHILNTPATPDTKRDWNDFWRTMIYAKGLLKRDQPDLEQLTSAVLRFAFHCERILMRSVEPDVKMRVKARADAREGGRRAHGTPQEREARNAKMQNRLNELVLGDGMKLTSARKIVAKGFCVCAKTVARHTADPRKSAATRFN